MRGHSRPDITTRSLRFWTLTNPLSKLSSCVPASDGPLGIVAVMHGKRNIRRILKERQ
jgi:hypothetical protein